MSMTTEVSRAEKEQWFAARTLTDLADLTARWLEGDLAYNPGYPAPGPDRETIELVPALALLNRAGWLTDCSQPAHMDEEYTQRAACTGFTDSAMADRLATVASAAGLLTVVRPVERRWFVLRQDYGIEVTNSFGMPATFVGFRVCRGDVRLLYGRGCHPLAVDAVNRSVNLTVVDPIWGREDLLWSVLREAVAA